MPAAREKQDRVSGVNEGAPQEAQSVFFSIRKDQIKRRRLKESVTG